MDLMESLIASKLLGSGGGGGGSTLISKTITRNGDYNASDDEADGYSDVKVNVSPSLLNKTIKSNGTYKADAFNTDGFGNIVVDVSDISTNTITITATENGTYTGGPNIQYTVPLPSTIEPKTDTQIEMPKGVFNDFNRLTISYTNTTSGDSGIFTMKPSDVVTAVYPQSIESRTMVVNNDSDNFIFITKLESVNNDIIIIYLAGFTINYIKFNKYAPLIESVEVDVEPNVIEKTITENGTYNAVDDEVDGYSKVIINVGSGGETKYYEYIRALNGQIIVRVEYPDAERTYATETLWFFNGYYTDSIDKDIPSILIPYLPKNWSTDVMMTSGYTDNTSSTQLGWIGFLYPNQTPPSTKIRTWNIGKGGLESGTFWGVLDISGPEEQTTEWFDPYENVDPADIKNYGGTIEDGYNINATLKALGNVYKDTAMSYEIDNDSFDITWNESGAYIGFSLNGDVDLKASDIQRISYKINFGTCYDNANNQNIRPFIIGVTDTIRTTPSTGVYFDPSQVDNYFTKYKMYYKDICNTTVEDFVDISDIDGPCYLFIVATGWIASITDLSMISNCTPQIGTTLSQFNFFNYMNENSSTNKINPVDTETFDVYWSGGIYIGHCLTGTVPLSGKKRLDINMDYIGENYQHSSSTHTRNYNLAVVVTDNKIDGYVNLDSLESQGHILAIKEWDGNDVYGQNIHTSIDLSNISGEYYINYQLPGFNISGFKTRLYSVDSILPKYSNNLIKQIPRYREIWSHYYVGKNVKKWRADNNGYFLSHIYKVKANKTYVFYSGDSFIGNRFYAGFSTTDIWDQEKTLTHLSGYSDPLLNSSYTLVPEQDGYVALYIGINIDYGRMLETYCLEIDNNYRESGSNPSIISWDLTQSLTSNNGLVITTSGATQSSNGLTFNTSSDYAIIPTGITNKFIYEFDINNAEWSGDTSVHGRMLLPNNNSGFIWRKQTQKWEVYDGSEWKSDASSSIYNSNPDIFNGKTLKIQYNSSNKLCVYANNDLVYREPQTGLLNEISNEITIGGREGQSFNTMTITGIRIYPNPDF